MEEELLSAAVCLRCIWRDEQDEPFGRARKDILGRRDNVSDSREGVEQLELRFAFTKVVDFPLAISWVCA